MGRILGFKHYIICLRGVIVLAWRFIQITPGSGVRGQGSGWRETQGYKQNIILYRVEGELLYILYAVYKAGESVSRLGD